MRTATLHKPAARRGVTLLEMLLAATVMALIAVCTLTTLSDSRALRERAHHHAEMALWAQGELERLRVTPLAKLAPKETTVHRDGWPASVSAVESVRKRPDGYTELSVHLIRKNPVTDILVDLMTIHPGGRP